MYAAGWIEVHVIWHGGNDDPATLHFCDVVPQVWAIMLSGREPLTRP